MRTLYPDIAITTDIIVGFPGETDEDFEETLAFAQTIGFAQIHVFPYSPRKGTPAANDPDQVPAPIKTERARRLGELAEELHQRFLKEQAVKTEPVLFEEKQEGYWIGHTSNYQKVFVRSDKNLSGQLVCVRISEPFRDGLSGGICGAEE